MTSTSQRETGIFHSVKMARKQLMMCGNKGRARYKILELMPQSSMNGELRWSARESL